MTNNYVWVGLLDGRWTCSWIKINVEFLPNFLPRKLLKSILSFFIGVMDPFALILACDSKFGGNRSRGRTNVWTVHLSFSGGVGSSISTGV